MNSTRMSVTWSSSPEPGDRGALLLSLLLLAALSAVALLARPLTPIDETRYAGVAWEMWLRGDFLVPYKNGEPYSHKPPLLFWTLHAGWALFGVNDTWPRLVLPLFSAAGLLLTRGLARRLWPDHAGLGGEAALILSSSLLWAVFSTALMFDVMLTVWVLVGMHGVLAASEGRRRGFVLLGAAIGLGMLTKGPVVLLNLLPVAALAPWWHRALDWRRWWRGLSLAVLVGAGVALAWAIPAGLAGGEAYRAAIFWGQTADRMVDSFAHRRPFWWYLPLLPLLLFPWFVWPALWRALAHHGRCGLDRGTRFCLAWMLPVLVAFSFVSGKQPHYLLPLFPAFALLAARLLARYPATGIGLPALLVAALGGGLLLAAHARAGGLAGTLALPPPSWPGALLAGLALAAWLAVRRGAPPLPSLALLGAATLALVQLAAMRSIEPLYDVRPMAQAIRPLQAAGVTVANAAKYHDQYQFAGRLTAPLVELRGDPGRWLAAHPGVYVVVYLDSAEALARVPTLHRQRYRGGVAALVDAKTAAALLAVPSN